jgi:hypothetical protein
MIEFLVAPTYLVAARRAVIATLPVAPTFNGNGRLAIDGGGFDEADALATPARWPRTAQRGRRRGEPIASGAGELHGPADQARGFGSSIGHVPRPGRVMEIDPATKPT